MRHIRNDKEVGGVYIGIKKVSDSVTLPATSNGMSSVQITTSVPVGNTIIGHNLKNISTYSDAIVLSATWSGTSCRITYVSRYDAIPQITLTLETFYI